MTYFEATEISTHVFIADGRIIDFIHTTTGKGIFGRSLEEVQKEYPTAVVMEKEQAYIAMDAANYNKYHSAPKHITEELYLYMFEVLPPLHYRSTSAGETFKMSEFTCGDLTGIYAHIGNKYYAMCDRFILTHEEIIAQCLASEVSQ